MIGCSSACRFHRKVSEICSLSNIVTGINVDFMNNCQCHFCCNQRISKPDSIEMFLMLMLSLLPSSNAICIINNLTLTILTIFIVSLRACGAQLGFNQPGTINDNENPPGNLEKPWKPTKNHEKPSNYHEKPCKPSKNHEKP